MGVEAGKLAVLQAERRIGWRKVILAMLQDSSRARNGHGCCCSSSKSCTAYALQVCLGCAYIAMRCNGLHINGGLWNAVISERIVGWRGRNDRLKRRSD